MSEGAPRSVDRNGHNGPAALTPELRERLREVERAVSPDRLAEIWVFPPLEELAVSSEFLLFTRRLDGGRLLVCSALVDGEDGGTRVVAHGEVPEERMPRFVERFRRRLEEERDPIHVEVGGCPDRWHSLLGPVDGEGRRPRSGSDDAAGASGSATAEERPDGGGTGESGRPSAEPGREAA